MIASIVQEEETKESQSQNTPDVIDITEDENQEPNRESLTCTQNDVEVLSNGNEDTPKLRSEHDEEISSEKGGESDDGNKDNKEDHISVVEDGSNSTSEESDRLLFADTLLVYLQKRKEKGRIRYKWDGQIGGLKDFVSLILKKEGRWKSKTNKGGGAIHTFQEKASEFNLTFWTSSRTLSVQANDGNKEKLLDKFERLMIRTSPEEVTQADFAKHKPGKKMVKENRTDILGEPPELHRKDKSVNYNDELKNVWAVLNEMKVTLNILSQDRGFKIDEQTPHSNKESVSEKSNGNLSTEKNTNQSKGKREKLITDYFRKVSVTQLQQMNDHKKFVELKEKLQQVEMEKNILIDKIRALTKENTELKKLQGSAVQARTESTQKIPKATAKNKRVDRVRDKPEVSQQRKAPTAQNVIMEDEEDQVGHRTGM